QPLHRVGDSCGPLHKAFARRIFAQQGELPGHERRIFVADGPGIQLPTLVGAGIGHLLAVRWSTLTQGNRRGPCPAIVGGVLRHIRLREFDRCPTGIAPTARTVPSGGRGVDGCAPKTYLGARVDVANVWWGGIQMLVIGLTGNIGSGKSTVAQLLSERGATIIDADVIARRAVEFGTSAHKAITARWGTSILTSESGPIDRAALRRVVFSEPAELEQLNAI